MRYACKWVLYFIGNFKIIIITLISSEITHPKTAIVYVGQTNTAPRFKSEKRIANLIEWKDIQISNLFNSNRIKFDLIENRYLTP